jgi:hypothetical protein
MLQQIFLVWGSITGLLLLGMWLWEPHHCTRWTRARRFWSAANAMLQACAFVALMLAICAAGVILMLASGVQH